MPTRAPRRCTRQGCMGGASCSRHNPPRPPRPSSSALGYDREWREISERYRKDHPWCQGCAKRGSRHVDHIDGDNTNHEEWNLQALCIPCHSKKTVEHDGGFGNPRTPR